MQFFPLISRLTLFISIFLISACSGDSISNLADEITLCTTDCEPGPGTGTGTGLLVISWDANPDEDMITSYSIYVGQSSDNVNTWLDDIYLTDPGFSPEAPEVTYQLSSGILDVLSGSTGCFQVQANNAVGSTRSFPQCITIN